jgi:hypothetical protein
MVAHRPIAIRTQEKVLVMVRTLLGVVLSGTLLLGWCWYYSDHLPQDLQRLTTMTQHSEEAEPAAPAEEGSEPAVTLVQGPLAFHMFQQDAETGLDWRVIGLGLASFLCVSVVAAFLLTMARLRSYFARVAFVFLLGVFAAVLVQMCDYLFWQQTINTTTNTAWDLTMYKSMFFVSAALIAGIVLAIFVRPQPTPVRIPVKVR